MRFGNCVAPASARAVTQWKCWRMLGAAGRIQGGEYAMPRTHPRRILEQMSKARWCNASSPSSRDAISASCAPSAGDPQLATHRQTIDAELMSARRKGSRRAALPKPTPSPAAPRPESSTSAPTPWTRSSRSLGGRREGCARSADECHPCRDRREGTACGRRADRRRVHAPAGNACCCRPTRR